MTQKYYLKLKISNKFHFFYSINLQQIWNFVSFVNSVSGSPVLPPNGELSGWLANQSVPQARVGYVDEESLKQRKIII